MANTPQAKKRIRRNTRRTEFNTNRVSRIRTFIKNVELAIASGDKTAAGDALKAMQPELARGVAIRGDRKARPNFGGFFHVKNLSSD